MGLLSEAATFSTAMRPLDTSCAAGIDRATNLAIVRHVERAQQLETAWFAIVRTASHRIASLEDRTRSIERTACLIGAIGLIVVVAAQFYRLIPYEYAFATTMVGVAVSTAPFVLILWPSLRENRELNISLMEKMVRARVHARFAKRIAQAADHLQRRKAWTSETQKSLGWLLEGMEADVDKLGKELRVARSEGRKHRRIVPRHCKVVVRTRDGRSLTGNIADISLSGVALSERLPRVALKEEVLIAGRAATVVRIWDTGTAMAFKQHLDPATFDEDLVL